MSLCAWLAQSLSSVESKPEKLIGTHNGSFHADEVMACAILKLHPHFRNARIERLPRNRQEFDEYDIVVDTGGRFCHKDGRYDHHQQDFDLTAEKLSKGEIKSNTKLSSAGLVFMFYGKDVIMETLQLEEGLDKVRVDWIWKKVYWNLLKEIDHIDNHGSVKGELVKTGISARIGQLNPAWDHPRPDYDQPFNTALELARQEFLTTLRRMNSMFKAKLALRERVLERRRDHESGQVLIFDKFTDWSFNILEIEEETGIDEQILFVINPCYHGDDQKNFHVSSVARRILFPREWRAERGEVLQRVTGVRTVKFVHYSRHLAVTQTREDAVLLVNIVLARQYNPSPQRSWRKEVEVWRPGSGAWRERERNKETEKEKKRSDIWRPGSGAWRERERRKEASTQRENEKGTEETEETEETEDTVDLVQRYFLWLEDIVTLPLEMDGMTHLDDTKTLSPGTAGCVKEAEDFHCNWNLVVRGRRRKAQARPWCKSPDIN